MWTQQLQFLSPGLPQVTTGLLFGRKGDWDKNNSYTNGLIVIIIFRSEPKCRNMVLKSVVKNQFKNQKL